MEDPPAPIQKIWIALTADNNSSMLGKENLSFKYFLKYRIHTRTPSEFNDAIEKLIFGGH